MNLSREEIQDLEDAIYFAGELIALRQGQFADYSEHELERAGKFVQRLLKLKTKLGSRVAIGGRS